MGSSFVEVPSGMSYVNAWHALYENAEPTAFFRRFPGLFPKYREQVATAQKVIELFEKNPVDKSVSYHMEYEGGKAMKIHFHQFPVLEVCSYDSLYSALGEDRTAAQVLVEYGKTPSEERFDTNDESDFSSLPPCYCLECRKRRYSSLSSSLSLPRSSKSPVEKILNSDGVFLVPFAKTC